MLVTGKTVCFPVQPVQSIPGPYPQIPGMILINTLDIIIAKAITVSRVIPADHYFMAVVPVQSVAGADPDKPPAVLENGFNGAVGQPLLAGESGKA
jgi:hypothetical protein